MVVRMKVNKELIAKNNKAFKSCHASNVCFLSNQTIMVVWFAGSKEGASDVTIWGSIRDNNGWTDPKPITVEENVPHWNPVLFEIKENELLLFYKIGDTIATWKTMIMSSYDNGKTWSEAREMIPGDAGGRGPVRNKLIQLKNHRILAPASSEAGVWRCFVDYSDDFGMTWKKSNDIYATPNEDREIAKDYHAIPVSEQSYVGRGIIQPSLWESDTGVHMFMRSTEGYVFRSDSKDAGATFCQAYQTNIPNNNSGIDVVRHCDGNLYLVYNPVGISWGKRTPLYLACSEDDGLSFRDILVLEEGEGEYSYPSIISQNECLYLTYTYNRENIAFWKISI